MVPEERFMSEYFTHLCNENDDESIIRLLLAHPFHQVLQGVHQIALPLSLNSRHTQDHGHPVPALRQQIPQPQAGRIVQQVRQEVVGRGQAQHYRWIQAAGRAHPRHVPENLPDLRPERRGHGEEGGVVPQAGELVHVLGQLLEILLSGPVHRVQVLQLHLEFGQTLHEQLFGGDVCNRSGIYGYLFTSGDLDVFIFTLK